MPTVAEEIAFTRGLIAGRQRLSSLDRNSEQQVHNAALGGREVTLRLQQECAHGGVHGAQVVLGSGCQFIHAHTVEEPDNG